MINFLNHDIDLLLFLYKNKNNIEIIKLLPNKNILLTNTENNEQNLSLITDIKPYRNN